MAPLIVDKEAKKEEIFLAAASVFAEKGFSGTRMEDVAVRAKMGKGTIYEYFKSKDALFFGLYDYLLNEFHKKIYAVMAPDQTPSEALSAIVSATLRAFDEWHDYGFLLMDFWKEHRRGTFLQIEFSAVYDKSRDIISRLIDDGIGKGEFTHVDSRAAASAIIGILDGVMLQRVFDPDLYGKCDIETHIPALIFMGLKKR